jgi:uncharacterized protein (TIGR02444 family)
VRPVLQCDSPFWSFSLAVYAAPGVAPECLALQDAHGADVNVLLFCAWLGSKGVVLTAANLAAIEAAAQPWREAAVRPLRSARRGIKAIADATEEDVAALRKDVAALELRAEQIAQAMLYRLAPTFGEPVASASAEAIHRNVAALLGERSAPRLVEAALAHADN